MSSKTSSLISKFQLGTRHYVLLLILITVLPVLGLILYNDAEDRDEAHKLGRNQAMEVLRTVNLKQQNVIESTHQLLTAFGQLPAIQNYDTAACSKLLGSMLNQYTQYLSLIALKPDGQLFCATPYPYREEQYGINQQLTYEHANSTQELSTSNYTISELSGKPALDIIKPVLGDNGEIHSFIAAKIDLSWLEQLILRLPLYDESVLTVFDINGTILLQYPPQADDKTGNHFNKSELVQTVVKLRHLGVMENQNEMGIDYLHAYAPLGENDVNAYISISIPTDVILSKASSALQQNLLLAGIVTITAILVSFGWSFRLFINPIRNLAEAATHVSQGKLNTQLGTSGGPKELSQLGTTFNQMTTALKHRADDQERIEHALSQLIQQHRNVAPAEFLLALASILADSLVVKYCLVGLIDPDNSGKIQTKILWGNGEKLEDRLLDIEDTPHADLIYKERYRIYRSNILALFPEDPILNEFNIESYAGITLTDFSQNIRGILVVMDDKPIKNDDMCHSLLQIFSARITAEIEREKTEQQRLQLLSEMRLAATAFESHECMFITDADRTILRVNQAFTEITGHDENDIVGTKPCALFSDDPPCTPCNRIWKEAKSSNKWAGEIELKCKNGKPFPANLTISAVERTPGDITHYVAHFQDITERKLAESRIQHLAYHDDLTDLPNRSLLLDRLDKTLASLKRRNDFGALMFIDLDHFKNINDSLGHPVGDALLIGVADRLRDSLRQEDTIARLGGDEFVVLLPQLSSDRQQAMHEAHAIGTKILQTLSDEYKIAGHTLKTTVSIGIVIFPDQELNADDILRHADLAMYSAKSAGRGSVQFFEPEMQSRLIERLRIEDELKIAYEQDQFILYYQPQIEIETNNIIGCEVLLRWQHPENGLTAPGAFISILEDSGLIRPVGKWILSQACAALAGNRILANHKNRPVVAVNISSRQFLDGDFVEGVASLLKEYNIDGDRLELEITERAVIQDVEETIRKMKSLKELGVRFSIDDFGTGYSSLSYIKRLPIDTLKIDRSFIQDCMTDQNDKAIVRAIVSMAHSLELGLIAEGVETRQQLEFLKQIGCNSYQGYYYSPPIPADQFTLLLEDSPRKAV